MTRLYPFPSNDRLSVIQAIRAIFARSPAFRHAVISDPLAGRQGQVALDVRFGREPTALRIVAPTADEAYALLHELATSMVESDRGMKGTPCPAST